MSDVAIRVENLSKRYTIGSNGERHDTLRDALVAALHRSGKRRAQRAKGAEFWALRDVSFEIKRGEVVGVIGRNGAGKSTLLKILSRITEPTSGRAEIHGRVGSLLEVGTGFHPELTGRENIYLNGAILGMKRAEIDRKFDEIVAFAEIDRFLDTPVKRYSSGMYVRLAFAVAAHLEPEILLVDEVLAVGDAAFQKKCLGKMGDVAGEGRTVVFVSHNMAAVENLCRRTLLFDEGHLNLTADASAAVSAYQNTHNDTPVGVFLPEQSQQTGGERTCVVACELLTSTPETGKPLELLIGLERDASLPTLVAEVAVTFCTSQGTRVLQAYSAHMGQSVSVCPGRTYVVFSIESLPLVEGEYWANLWVGAGDTPLHFLRECMRIRVRHGAIASGRIVDARGYPVVVCSKSRVVERIAR